MGSKVNALSNQSIASSTIAKCFGLKTLGEGIGIPVYAGRLPITAIETLKKLQFCNSSLFSSHKN